ncbi:MAG: lipoate protein ligase C-terminal domain-containing protein [Nitrososphaeraceae archaeon]
MKINLIYDEEQNRIHSILITGDFFLHPEETLEEIERNLSGARADEDTIRHKVSQSLADSQPFGFDAKSLSTAILLCLKQDTNMVS